MFQTRTLKQGKASKTDVFFRDMDSLKLDVTIWYAEGWHLVATQAKSVVGKPLAMPANREKTVLPNCLTSGCWRSVAITQNRAQWGRFAQNLAALLTSKLSWLSVVVYQAEVKQQKVRNKPEMEAIFNSKFHYRSVTSWQLQHKLQGIC